MTKKFFERKFRLRFSYQWLSFKITAIASHAIDSLTRGVSLIASRSLEIFGVFTSVIGIHLKCAVALTTNRTMNFYWELLVLTIVLTFIAKRFSAFHVKFFLAYSWVLTWAALYIPVAAFRPRNVKNLMWENSRSANNLWLKWTLYSSRVLSKILKFTGTICGIKCTFRGQENVSAEKTCILVANHQSALDLIGK